MTYHLTVECAYRIGIDFEASKNYGAEHHLY